MIINLTQIDMITISASSLNDFHHIQYHSFVC